MAQISEKPQRSRAADKPPQAPSSPSTGGAKRTYRTGEMVGLSLFVLALLLGMAVVSYSPADQFAVTQFSLSSLFDPPDLENLVGVLGALYSYFTVERWFGYASISIPLLLGMWAYALTRNTSKLLLPRITVLSIALTYVLAMLAGWVGQFTGGAGPWAGAISELSAQKLSGLLGKTGALLTLLLVLVLGSMTLIDLHLQRTLDRLERWFFSARDGIALWWARRATSKPHAPEPEPPRERAPRPAPRVERAPDPEPEPERPATLTPPRFPTPPAQAPAAPVSRTHAENPFPIPPSRPTPAAPPAAHEEPGELTLRVQERVTVAQVEDLAPLDQPIDEDLPYDPPHLDLLEYNDQRIEVNEAEMEDNKRVLLDKLETYRIEITDINAIVGPTVTMYELTPAPGIKIRRITELEDDLAMAMAARGIRMIAPIPGKSVIGVEIPNRRREVVRIRECLAAVSFAKATMELPICIGKTIEGDVFVEDLTKMPHLLIAGATGSGKSVGLNTLIAGLLYRCHPSNLKFVMIDPKKIELTQYGRLRDHFIALPGGYEDAIVTDFSQAMGVLKSCEKEMERRYDKLSKAGVRGIRDYNRKFADGTLSPTEGHEHLPYIVVVVDELADLMMTAGKEIEGPIARLAQMARAVGIHLVLATQRPSVDVITGLIKANFPSRIAYQVASKVDSRVIMDQQGAEQLVGNGDLLYMNGARMVRLQGPYVSVEEVDAVTDFIADQQGSGPYRLPALEVDETEVDELDEVDDQDDLFEEAARILVRSQSGSVSLLQRKLSIGYTRAARIVDQLEMAGILGPADGSRPRQVLVRTEMELDTLFKSGGPTMLDFP